VRPVHARQRHQGLPGPHRGRAPHRHDANPIRRRQGCQEHSGIPGSDPEVSRPADGGAGPVKRKTWVLAGAAVLVAVTATGGVVVMSSAKQATPAAQEPPANTVKVEKGDALGQGLPGWDPAFRARSDGSPYAVINQARGT